MSSIPKRWHADFESRGRRLGLDAVRHFAQRGGGARRHQPYAGASAHHGAGGKQHEIARHELGHTSGLRKRAANCSTSGSFLAASKLLGPTRASASWACDSDSPSASGGAASSHQVAEDEGMGGD
jgi:hypothetical protein